MALSSCLGFPRMGANRELKKLVEGFWAGKISEGALLAGAKELRAKHWGIQKSSGLDHIPSNDFSLFDHVLDAIAMVGAIPERFRDLNPGLEAYFAMGRGLQRPASEGVPGADVASLEMKKWLDTNYHFFVPEIGPHTAFSLSSNKAEDEFKEALSLGIRTRPVLLGPVSLLLLSKGPRGTPPSFCPLSLLPSLLPVYQELLRRLREAGAQWVQIDEPVLALDHPPEVGLARGLTLAYSALTQTGLEILVATYFDRAEDNLAPLFSLPVSALHVDLVRAPQQLPAVLAGLGPHQRLSLGLVDGRNVWRADLDAAIRLAQGAVKVLGAGRVLVAPSCSLLHCPHSLASETSMDAETKSWLAFALEKLHEVKVIADALNCGTEAVRADVDASSAALANRRASPRIHVEAVRRAVAGVNPAMLARKSPFPTRQLAQVQALGLPLLPTTTIGSFPQTAQVRGWRAKLKRGEMSSDEYNALIADQVRKCVEIQEELGLDVLVHGEFERTDMVEFFGENLEGVLFTQGGWVQSYGSRCVKPPVIFGDVSRSRPMTVRWTEYAQSLTKKPMKGMITGPITCLQWSFVRNDQPRKDTACQLALAMRDEVADLEGAGIRCIQVDEPAIREGLPLRASDRGEYLQWAVDAFLLSSTGVANATQIHTHMCYSDFNDIFDSIQRMDADVITIENSKSDLKLLEAFERHGYANEIGPGLYDIHSPRVPSVSEMGERLSAMLQLLPANLLWVNPDCGLKTRGWPETLVALKNMVQVAQEFRIKLA